MMGELKFFLKLEIRQREKGIIIHQQKYIKMFNKLNMSDAKPMKALMHAFKTLV